jgi:hypothetical protein
MFLPTGDAKNEMTSGASHLRGASNRRFPKKGFAVDRAVRSDCRAESSSNRSGFGFSTGLVFDHGPCWFVLAAIFFRALPEMSFEQHGRIGRAPPLLADWTNTVALRVASIITGL